MSLQIIQDGHGNTTGVYIPIEDWRELKAKYSGLNAEEEAGEYELAEWQKTILDKRLKDLEENPNDVKDISETLRLLAKKK